jgi:hypothetical protein
MRLQPAPTPTIETAFAPLSQSYNIHSGSESRAARRQESDWGEAGESADNGTGGRAHRRLLQPCLQHLCRRRPGARAPATRIPHSEQEPLPRPVRDVKALTLCRRAVLLGDRRPVGARLVGRRIARRRLPRPRLPHWCRRRPGVCAPATRNPHPEQRLHPCSVHNVITLYWVRRAVLLGDGRPTGMRLMGRRAGPSTDRRVDAYRGRAGGRTGGFGARVLWCRVCDTWHFRVPVRWIIT